MRFGTLKVFTGSSLLLLLCAIGSPAGMAQEMQLAQRPPMNRENCSEAYRGRVVRINNDRVAVEMPNGERRLLSVPRTQQASLGVAIGNELVVCQDGTVTVPVENMAAMGDDGGLRDRIAETFRRLEQEEAERRRAAARELEQTRMEQMRSQPVQTAPATTPVPMREPVRVEPARPAPAPQQPVRALW